MIRLAASRRKKRPIPPGLTRAHVLKTLADLDNGIEDSLFGTPTRYELSFDRRRYAPKAVVGLACRYSLGRVLHPEEFSGGEGPGQANFVLKALGFKIETKAKREKEPRVDRTARVSIFPNEVAEPAKYVEGATRVVTVNAYERNSKARDACIRHYGCNCAACGFNFGAFYGDIGEGFIHVHHLKDLATIAGEYEVNPVKDLRPVCPNCHAMLHVTTPAMSIESLQAVIRRRTASPVPTAN